MKGVVDSSQFSRIYIEYGDRCSHTKRYTSCVLTHVACAQHNYIGGRDAWYASKEHSSSAVRFFKVFRPLLRSHPSSDFTHWRQKRQIAIVGLNRFIRDTDNPGFSEARCKRLGSREVEIGEEDLSLFQQWIFAGEGL